MHRDTSGYNLRDPPIYGNPPPPPVSGVWGNESDCSREMESQHCSERRRSRISKHQGTRGNEKVGLDRSFTTSRSTKGWPTARRNARLQGRCRASRQPTVQPRPERLLLCMPHARRLGTLAPSCHPYTMGARGSEHEKRIGILSSSMAAR